MRMCELRIRGTAAGGLHRFVGCVNLRIRGTAKFAVLRKCESRLARQLASCFRWGSKFANSHFARTPPNISFRVFAVSRFRPLANFPQGPGT